MGQETEPPWFSTFPDILFKEETAGKPSPETQLWQQNCAAKSMQIQTGHDFLHTLFRFI